MIDLLEFARMRIVNQQRTSITFAGCSRQPE